MTRPAGPRQAEVYFLLAGDPDRGLAEVSVIEWDLPWHSNRSTRIGPDLFKLRLNKDDEIEHTILTERRYGGCRSDAPGGKTIMVDLHVPEGNRFSGESYTLALAVADKRARGCLPRLAGRTLIATGQVKDHGTIAKVGKLAQKFEALKRALDKGTIAAPLLILPRENLDALSGDEQRLLQDLKAAGVQCEWVAALKDMGCDCLAEPLAEPGRDLPPAREITQHQADLAEPLVEPDRDPPPARWRNWLRKPRRVTAGAPGLRKPMKAANAPGWGKPLLAVALMMVLIGGALVWRYPLPCASLSADPAIIERCWGPLPVSFRAKCTVKHGNGDRLERRCPSGTWLAADDEFALEVRPDADGWLSVYYQEAAGQVLEDLRRNQPPGQVRAGLTEPVTLPNPTNPSAGRPPAGHYFAVLTRGPLPLAADPVLKEFLGAVAEEFVLRVDP